jgi:hypothetical protein
MTLRYLSLSVGEFIRHIVSGVTATAYVLIILGALLFATVAFARDVGQWEGSNPLIQHWYKSLMQPDNPSMSCCGESDSYWADQIEFKNGKVFAVITDTRPDGPLNRMHVPPGTRVEVPPNKLKFYRGNPTGHTVIFLGAGLSVLCFVQTSGV